MKALIDRLLLLLIAVIFSQCKKDVSVPNENWVIGASWIDTRDGHTYPTVPIGNQVWTAENMAYLPKVNKITDGSESQGKEKDAFYYVYGYNNTDTSEAKATADYKHFGVLYNWTAAQNACPDGWHLPTDTEWIDLELYLGMSSTEVIKEGNRGINEGAKIKSTWGWDFITWTDKYGNGTNETGFTALPGGNRYQDISVSPAEYIFNGTGYSSSWWTATESTASSAWYRFLINYSDVIYRYNDEKPEAMSVRCVKN
jgi:uncharacterized protein (TIGR02145 family)